MEEERDPVQQFLDRAAPMIEKDPNFLTVVDRPRFSEEERGLILGSEYGPQIAYDLATGDPVEAERIAALTGTRLNREIIHLEHDQQMAETAAWFAEEREKKIAEIKRGGL